MGTSSSFTFFPKMICLVLLSLLGTALGANVICTNYQKDIRGGGGGPGIQGYYQRPIPHQCRGKHGPVAGWRPNFKIKEPLEECPQGWKKWKGHCYSEVWRQRGRQNFMDAERICNKHQGHVWQPNSREEMRWTEQNVMTHNGWYFVGIFCTIGRHKGRKGNNVASHMFTTSGEDMRKINQDLRATMQ